MRLSRLYRFLLLAAAGGMLFQTSTVSCQKQIAESFGVSFAEAFGTALAAIIAGAIQGGTTGT